jgi:hypothetical protein
MSTAATFLESKIIGTVIPTIATFTSWQKLDRHSKTVTAPPTLRVMASGVRTAPGFEGTRCAEYEGTLELDLLLSADDSTESTMEAATKALFDLFDNLSGLQAITNTGSTGLHVYTCDLENEETDVDARHWRTVLTFRIQFAMVTTA